MFKATTFCPYDKEQESIKQLAGWAQIIPTYFHTDNKYKRKATSEIDKQYENEIPPATDDENTFKNSNIVQFPFGKAVNQ